MRQNVDCEQKKSHFHFGGQGMKKMYLHLFILPIKMNSLRAAASLLKMTHMIASLFWLSLVLFFVEEVMGQIKIDHVPVPDVIDLSYCDLSRVEHEYLNQISTQMLRQMCICGTWSEQQIDQSVFSH